MWVFNTRHDFGVETDPTQGEFFVKTSSTAEQCPPARWRRPAFRLISAFCFPLSALVPWSLRPPLPPANQPMILYP